MATKRKRPPSIDFYYDDFLAGVNDMHPLAVGMYIKSICFQLGHDSLPNDPRKLQQITGTTPEEFAEFWPEVTEKLVLTGDGRLINERAQAEMQHKLEVSTTRSKCGSKGGRPPKAKGKANEKQKAKQTIKQKESIPEVGSRKKEEGSKEDGRRKTEDGVAAFGRFWEVFPRGRRKSKGAAQTAFTKALSMIDAGTLIRRATEYAASGEGQSDFVKMPSTWLTQCCWEDDDVAWAAKETGNRRASTGINFLKVKTHDE